MTTYSLNQTVDERDASMTIDLEGRSVYRADGSMPSQEELASALMKVAGQQETLRLCLEQQRLAWETEALKLAEVIDDERKRFDRAQERARTASHTDDAVEAAVAASYVASAAKNLGAAADRLRLAVERRDEVEGVLAILDLGMCPAKAGQ